MAKLKDILKEATVSAATVGTTSGSIAHHEYRLGGDAFEGNYFPEKVNSEKLAKSFHKASGPMAVSGYKYVMDIDAGLEDAAAKEEDEIEKQIRKKDAGIRYDLDKDKSYKALINKLKKAHNI